MGTIGMPNSENCTGEIMLSFSSLSQSQSFFYSHQELVLLKVFWLDPILDINLGITLSDVPVAGQSNILLV